MSGLLGKVKSLFTEIKTHWNTPAEGKYVPYKEYKDVVFAVGSNYAGKKVLEYIGFFSSCYLIMHHYKLLSAVLRKSTLPFLKKNSNPLLKSATAGGRNMIFCSSKRALP